ncbi:MAG: TonB-dependent receptor [Marinirhabdus sp.]|nr:TonB-dependent receptor [Marinirhabdus sp.]
MQGRVVDVLSMVGVDNAKIQILQSSFVTHTDETGAFNNADRLVPLGEQTIQVSKPGYITKRIRVVLTSASSLNLDPILLELDQSAIEEQIGSISLSDQELQNDEGAVATITGLLQSSKDVFLTAAAYDFSATFFRPRGLDNAYGEVFINGIEMNKLYNGRPQWGTFGGLNDVQRNREFSMGLRPNAVSFGGLAGTTNMVMRASQFRQGGRVSYALANRSYQGRAMASYHSGLSKSGWAYSLLASRRFGLEGFQEGTIYDANSLFVSVEKLMNDAHAINVTAFYTPNRRGRSTAITREVERLKGRTYNPNWGIQNGAIRNSRIREIKEPIFMLNYNGTIGRRTQLSANVAYQLGTMGNTRIDAGGTRLAVLNGNEAFIGGARNPFGNYYQRLPSYFLRNENPNASDFQLAYLAQKTFIEDGQLDWDALYLANSISSNTGGNSIYVLQEDRVDDTQFSGNVLLEHRLGERITFESGLRFKHLVSENYAHLADLLGGTGYLDVDFFAEGDENVVVGDVAQSDLQNRNRLVKQGERYKYNFRLLSSAVNAFVQVEGKFRSVDFFAALTGGQKNYQREGLYENGNYPGARSLGKSEALSFTEYGAKGGVTLKFSGRHITEINGAYTQEAPALQHSFVNARQNNDITFGVEPPHHLTSDISYVYRSPILKARLTGFYRASKNLSEIGFYFTENLSGFNTSKSAFVQEVLTDVETENLGGELGFEAQLTTTFKIKGAAAYGVYRYANNPKLYLASDDFTQRLTFGEGTAQLQNYRVASGPEQAYQLGIEYRDPEYWWVGTTLNYFSHAFIDVNNLSRTANFYLDTDGQLLNDFDSEEASTLLQQEQFPSYYLLNIVGGKSWRIKRYYLGFFASINNLLDQKYITGGFEQGRLANFRDLKQDFNRPYGRIFGPRYFFGNGTTYYINFYLRF